jgi:hypothetical protein
VPITVAEFLLDDVNEDKCWEHGISSVRLLEVLENPHTIKRNRADRRGLHLLVGRDFQGRCIAIPIEPTHDPLTWRPITAWPCKQSEENWCP